MKTPVLDSTPEAPPCCSGAAAQRTAVAPSRTGRTLLALALALVGWSLAYAAIRPLSELLAFRALGLAPASHLGQSVAFFLYDAPKVLLLLVLIVFAVGMVRSFFTAERTRAVLAGKRESVGNVLAALLGVVTPFCSCSAVPLFLGFVEVGIPLGVTLSFLVAAPMVNEVALVLLFGLFGWKVAALYLVTGLAIAIASGFVLGRMKLERFVEPWVYASMKGSASHARERLGLQGRIEKGAEAVRDVVGKVWPWVLAGIAVGAGVHGYVPEGLLAGFMGKSAWWSVPAAVAIGVPMYSNAAGVIPVVEALLGKGAALGTVLAFMMSVIGLSLPEIVILRKVLRPPLIAAFVGIVALGILLVGWLFNAVL
ncbi:permease [Anaeromyxobacter terrae]|uniref:permease n=1 Tax=Anaeromyxobacter terrae TaxID=2925406 RepID=UPI001F586755|nr:permease [Anaeromyxobacter sp. SG22]